MTKNDLITALQNECLVDRTKVEDFLQALGDLCIDALAHGERFPIPEIGILMPIQSSGGRRVVSFATAERIKNRFGTPAPMCIVCRKNEREPKRKKCAACRERARAPKPRPDDENRFFLL